MWFFFVCFWFLFFFCVFVLLVLRFFSFYCGRGIYLEILSIKADSFRSSGHGWTRLALKNNALGTRISIGGFHFVVVDVVVCLFYSSWCWWRIDCPWRWWLSALLRLLCPCCPRPFRVVETVVGAVVVVVVVVLSRICLPLRWRSVAQMSNRLVLLLSQKRQGIRFLWFTVAVGNGRRRLGCENGFRIRAVELFESFDRTPNCLFQSKQIVALRNQFFFFFYLLLYKLVSHH